MKNEGTTIEPRIEIDPLSFEQFEGATHDERMEAMTTEAAIQLAEGLIDWRAQEDDQQNAYAVAKLRDVAEAVVKVREVITQQRRVAITGGEDTCLAYAIATLNLILGEPAEGK